MRPTTFLLAVATVVTAIGVGMTVVGSQTIGVSTDEPGHIRRTNSYLAYGLYTRPFERELTPAGQVPTGAYVYGPMTSLLQHEANRLVGNEPSWEAQAESRQYAVRHAVVGALALAGLLATIVIAWALLGDWRWGVIAGGILAATPLWTGHSMFNMKDVPVASGHTLITAGLILLALTRPTTKLWRVAACAVPLTGGVVLMLGTRPGSWPSLFASLVVFGIVLSRARREQTRANVVRVVSAVAVSLATSCAVLWAVYPTVFGNAISALTVSVTAGGRYDGLGDQPPNDRSYLPAHLLTDLPLGLLTLMVVGTAFAFMAAFGRRQSTRIDCLALAGSQAFALMGAAFVFDSNLYHGLRQMLFSVPALAVLATVGLAALLTKARPGAWRFGLVAMATLALLLPTAAQAALFPYQYSYVNVAAEQTGYVGHEGADYFATSFREYAHTAPQDVKVVCPFLRFGGAVERDDRDCRTRFGHTFSTYWRGRPTPDEPKDDEFYVLLRGSRPTPPNCTAFRQVERWGNASQIVMSRMFRCHPPTEAEKLAGARIIERERAKQGWARSADGKAWVTAG